MGYLYLLHLDRSVSGKGNRHYLGYSKQKPDKRIAQHRAGTSGAVFTTEAYRQGITFQVAGIWDGKTKDDERRIKRQKRHARYCAVCRPGQQSTIPPKDRTHVTSDAYNDVDLPY